MDSFGHKMIISSQPVPLTGTGVLYPRVRAFQIVHYNFTRKVDFAKRTYTEQEIF